MKIISLILFIVGIGFCIIGFNGHSAAWAAGALCFCATMMVILKQKRK